MRFLCVFVVLNIRTLSLFVWVGKCEPKFRFQTPIIFQFDTANHRGQLRNVAIVHGFGWLNLAFKDQLALGYCLL